jgi:tetratricopeptide (TPR) repeat protein
MPSAADQQDRSVGARGRSARSSSSALAALAVGLLTGSVILGVARTVGSDPGALAWAASLTLFGAAFALRLGPRTGARLRAGLGAVGVVALLSQGLLAQLCASLARTVRSSPGQGVLVHLVALLLAITLALLPVFPKRPARSLALLAAPVGTALALVFGAMAGVVGVAIIGVVVGLTARHGRVDTPTPSPSPTATLAAISVAVLFAWSVSFVWTGTRAWLDPTPQGWLVTFTASAAGFTFGWVLARARITRSGVEPLLGALGVIVAQLALTVAAPWLAGRLPDWLLSVEPALALPALMAAPGALIGVLFGLAAPPRGAGSPAPEAVLLATGAGVVLGVQGGLLGSTLIPLAAVMAGVLVLLVGRAPLRRIAGLVAALLVGGTWWMSPPVRVAQLTAGWASAVSNPDAMGRHIGSLASSTWESASTGPEGSVALRRVGEHLVVDIDGTPTWSESRGTATTRYAAQLAALLARAPERFLVLGDELGHASIVLLANRPSSIVTGVSQPELLRTTVATSESLRRSLLAPQIQLRPVPAPWLLRWTSEVDGIVQVVPRAWPDSGGPLPDSPGFALSRSRLAPGGVYVLALATDRLPAARLARILEDFHQRFPSGVGCLPPVGADHIVLVGMAEDGPLPLSRVVDRFRSSPTTPRSLGLESELEIADRCVFTAADLAAWATEVGSSGPWLPMGLPASISAPPAVHLAAMAQRVSTPEVIWDPGEHEALLPALEARSQAAQGFLALLGDTRTGDMESLFARARILRESEGGERELATLIAPHLARARQHMDNARKGGLQHQGWQLALNELTLARMLNPSDTEAMFLEGMVHEARGDLLRSEQLYRAVIEASPEHLEALFGLARSCIELGRERQAEEALRQAVDAHPRSAAAHEVLGVALMRFGRLDEAEPILLEAAALAGSEHAQPQAALAELFLTRGRPAVAQAHVERALGIEASAYHYTLLGRCHFDLGRYIPAEKAFRQAVLLEPDFYPPRAGLAHIFAINGDYKQAEDALIAVLVADPHNEAAQANLQEIRRLIEAEQADPRISSGP